jgi:hypothetical protein
MILYINCSISDIVVETSVRLFMILDVVFLFHACLSVVDQKGTVLDGSGCQR